MVTTVASQIKSIWLDNFSRCTVAKFFLKHFEQVLDTRATVKNTFISFLYSVGHFRQLLYWNNCWSENIPIRELKIVWIERMIIIVLTKAHLRGYDTKRQTKTRPDNFLFSKFLNQKKPIGEKKHRKKFQLILSTYGWVTAILIFGPHSRSSWKKIEFYA